MRIENHTASAVSLTDEDAKVLFLLPADEEPAYVGSEYGDPVGEIRGVKVVGAPSPTVYNLPGPEAGVYRVVDRLVAALLPKRPDLYWVVRSPTDIRRLVGHDPAQHQGAEVEYLQRRLQGLKFQMDNLISHAAELTDQNRE